MTRKDYELIARCFEAEAAEWQDCPEATNALAYLAKRFAAMAVQQNSRFKADVFYAACGLTDAIKGIEA